MTTRALATSTRVVVLIPTRQLNNSNDRKHWSKGSKNRRILRNLTGWVAKQQAVPVATPAALRLEFAFDSDRRRDLDNVEVKGLIDGLVDAGIIPDDSRHHLTEVTRANDAQRTEKGYTRITATITSLDPSTLTKEQ